MIRYLILLFVITFISTTGYGRNLTLVHKVHLTFSDQTAELNYRNKEALDNYRAI